MNSLNVEIWLICPCRLFRFFFCWYHRVQNALGKDFESSLWWAHPVGSCLSTSQREVSENHKRCLSLSPQIHAFRTHCILFPEKDEDLYCGQLAPQVCDRLQPTTWSQNKTNSNQIHLKVEICEETKVGISLGTICLLCRFLGQLCFWTAVVCTAWEIFPWSQDVFQHKWKR